MNKNSKEPDIIYILLYQSYFRDAPSKEVEISKEEWEKLLPHEADLRKGNTPKEIYELVWNVARDRKKISQKSAEADKAKKITVALC
jgi:hypothetical protein